jgi:hypothetical protein
VGNQQINILASIELDDTSKISGTQDIATWEISYKTNSELGPELKKKCGKISVDLTTELMAIEEKEDVEVLLAVKIKEFGNKEKTRKILYESGKLTEVIANQKSYINELKEFVHKDPAGRILRLFQAAKIQLLTLENELLQKNYRSKLTPNQNKYIDRYGPIPTGRRLPILAPKRSPSPQIKPENLNSNSIESNSQTCSTDSEISETAGTKVGVVLGSNNNSQSRNSVLKIFSSAEYLCNKDRSFYWNNDIYFK